MLRKKEVRWPILALIIISVTLYLSGLVTAEGNRVIKIDFENVQGNRVFDINNQLMGVIKGEAGIIEDAHSGKKALQLFGAEKKGYIDLGPDFISNEEGTLDFWIKPAKTSGVIIGKLGAINIEISNDAKTIRFGLKLKDGWHHCEGPKGAVTLGSWHNIRTCWGKKGMFLYIDGEEVAHTELSVEMDWFIPDNSFLLGTYAHPTPYDSWYYKGIIDDFQFIPRQELLKSETVSIPKFTVSYKVPPKPNYDIPTPETISGIIYHDINKNGIRDRGENGIQDVSVTDGFSVVSTDKDGNYKLKPSEKSVFIYVTRPSGYNVTGYWYKPISPKINFALTKSEKDETEFTFIHVTDTHTSSSASLDGLKKFVKEVNNLDPPPLFVFNTGDLVNLDKQLTYSVSTGRTYFKNYTSIMNQLKIPYYNVAGDHTDAGYRMEQFPLGDFRCGKAMFWEYLGPNFFSFEYGNLHFVSIDFVYHLNPAGGTSHSLIPEHLSWLKQDLQHRRLNTIVITGSENILEGSIPEFYKLGKKYNIKLQLYGDNHVVSYNDTPVPSRCGGALAGAWWNGICADLSPPGYMIYHVQGEKMKCFYKELGKQISINTPGYWSKDNVGKCVKGQANIYASLVHGPSKGPLEYSIDGEKWRAMQEAKPSFYRKNYVAKLDSTVLADGIIKLRVRTADNSEIKEIPLVVDNNKGVFIARSDATLKLKVSGLAVTNKPPKGEVKVIFNGKEVATIFRQKTYNIPISVELLEKINHLTFDFSAQDDGMTMKEPVLKYDSKILQDLRQEAVRKVRLGHWSKKIVDASGVVVGKGHENVFAIRQNEFYFVLP